MPHAPMQAVTVNGGMQMRSWYDIKSMDLDKRADEQGVRESAAKVEQLITQEIANGIPASKIILALKAGIMYSYGWLQEARLVLGSYVSDASNVPRDNKLW